MSVLELRRMARNRHTNIKLTDTANKKRSNSSVFQLDTGITWKLTTYCMS